MPDFEIISEDEFKRGTSETPPAAHKSKASKHNTDDRTKTGWYKLPHTMGFCTVPSHDVVQETLNPEAKVYRQAYPTRMVFPIGDYLVCRDCFLAEADKE